MFSSRKTAAPSTGYNLTKSLRFRSSASASLTKTFGAGTSDQIMTISAWVKRGTLTQATGQSIIVNANSSPGGNEAQLLFNNTDNLRFYTSGGTYNIVTTQVFRDPSAWYHIVISIDVTQSTASNRVKFYVNGSQITSFSTANYPPQNTNIGFNNAYAHGIGAYTPGSTNYFDGYMAEFNFVDGQALTPSSFGSTNATTGVWQPAKYTGTYGTNGFYLPFTNTTSTTTLGYDSSGNSNNWTTNNFSLTAGSTYDSMTDVPTLTSATTANYDVINPIALGTSTVSDGNLKAVLSTTTSTTYSTLGMDSGKWYWEVTYLAATNNALFVGVNQFGNITTLGGSAGPSGAGGVGYYGFNGNKYVNGGGAAAYGSTFTTNDVIGVALDVGGGTITFYKNNTSQGAISLPTKTSSWMACFDNGTGAGTQTMAANFGQQPFVYTPPTGFVALNTYNLPTSTIVKGNTVMDATLYTGNGATNPSSQAIVNTAGFKPDFVWIKSRSNTYPNFVWDSIRGVANDPYLVTNSTAAENSDATGNQMSSFNSNGFSVQNTSGGSVGTNNNGSTFVGWQWQAGQGSTSSNTNGSITTTTSVNATAGFSVVTYTGNGSGSAQTIGHGLGVAPSMMAFKNRTNASDWEVYHISLGASNGMHFNNTGASSALTLWNSTAPTSSVATINGTGNEINQSGSSYVAYMWAAVPGFSAFSSYTGNGSTDGPFVYTGFRPKFVLTKRSDATESWRIGDSSRSPYNAVVLELFANLTNAEENNSNPIDYLSNGFKIRTSSSSHNANGGTYIYMVFAENPFKNALAR